MDFLFCFVFFTENVRKTEVTKHTQEETWQRFQLHLFLEQLMYKSRRQRHKRYEEAITRHLHFPLSGIFHLSRCRPVNRQGVNVVRRCLKHTLLFSNFTIVLGEIKRAFQHAAVFDKLSCLTSLLKNFCLTGPRSERSLDRRWELDDFHQLQWGFWKWRICNSSSQTQLMTMRG